MIVSQTAEYALRAMAWLATTPSGTPVRAADLSDSTGIPPHYLSKVLRRLVLADLLVSQKGQGGGFTLSRPAAEIPFIEILSAVDAYPSGDRCAFGWGSCDNAHPCPLHGAWSRLNDQIHEWASTTNLQEIADTAGADERFLPPKQG